MWIEGFQIDGFGVFHQAELRPLAPGLTVLLGDNEAGKSTTLDFFRTLFFGFPRKNSPDRRQHEPLAGGTLGGCLFLQDGDRVITLRRSPGTSGGTVALTAADGTPLPEAELGRLLGSMTEPFFRHVHAFSLDELQLVGNDREAVLAQLYGAASGAGKSLAAAEKLFEKQMADRFAPGGQKPLLNAHLKRFEELEQAIREARSQTDEYTQLEEQAKDLEEKLRETTDAHRLLHQRQQLLQAVQSHWGDWVDLLATESRLAELPEVPPNTPTDPEELDQLVRDLRAAETEVEKRRDELADTQGELADIVVDPALHAQRDQIRTLARQMAEFRTASQRLPVLEAESAQMRTALDANLRQLGPDWTDDRVRTCDRSVANRDALQRFAESLATDAQRLRETETACRRQEEERDTTLRRREQAEAALAAANQAAARFPAEVCAPLRRDRDRLVQLAQELPNLRRESDRQRQEAEAIAKRIDPAWTATQLIAFDTSAVAGERIQQAADRLARAERAVEDSERAVARFEGQIAQLGATPTEDVGELRRHLRELAQAQASLAALAETSRLPIVPLFAIAAVVIGILALAVHPAFWGGLALLVPAWFLMRRADPQNRQQTLRETVRKHAPALGLDPERPDFAAEEERLDQLAAQQRRAGEWNENLAASREALKQAQAGREQVLAAWTEQARTLDFTGSPTPGTVQRLFATIGEGQRLLAEARRLETTIRSSEEQLAEAWGRVTGANLLDHPPVAFAADLLDHALAAAAACEQRCREAQNACDQARLAEAEAVRSLAQAETERDAASKAREEGLGTWRTWLTERGLQPSLAPDTAREAFALLDRCWDQLQALAKLAEERERCQTTCATFLARTEVLLAILERPIVPPEQRETALEALVKAVEENEQQQATAAALRRQEGKGKQTLAHAEEHRQEAEADLNALLNHHGAENPDELRARTQLATQRQEATASQALLLRNLKTVLGTTDEASVRSVFTEAQPAELSGEIARLGNEVAERQEQMEALRNQRAAVFERRRVLASSDKIATLRQEQEAVRAELDAIALDWTRAALAQRLLTDAKRTFEQERQPEVLKEASAFFRLLTNERYAGLFSPLGSNRELLAQTADGRFLAPDQLSRGTVEQLYLALRFGFLADSARKGTCLPVIMDEILVNFDPARAAAAARAIARLSGTQQILFFTCHPATAELLGNEAKACRVVVRGGQFLTA